ncbi:MAG: protein translocase subunit SecD [Phycisphaerales bacterium]|nr:protein translocase subunit SecD [Phycisphaerales bacterium]
MVEKNLRQRFITIGIVMVIALLVLFRWDKDEGLTHNLRPGQDIAGGFSMIFEIDDTGVEDWQRATLAEDMKRLLQKRVDPTGVSDIQWAVLGQNRIEVRMPLPPPEAKNLQDEYLAEMNKLIEENSLSRSAIYAAMEAKDEQRQVAIDQLVGANPARKPVLESAAEAFDRWQAAKAALDAGPQPAPEPAEGEEAKPPKTEEDLKLDARDAEEEYRDIIDELLEENFPVKSFTEAMSMDKASPIRTNIVENLKTKYSAVAGEIDAVIAKNDAWRAKRGFLDGPADLRRMLSGAGVLEFRILADPPGANTARYDTLRQKLHDEGPANARDDLYAWFKVDNPPAFFNVQSIDQWPREQLEAKLRIVVEKSGDTFFVLGRISPDAGLLHEPGKTKWRLERASVTRDNSGRRAVAFQLDAVGGDLFRKLTRANVNKQLCILVDDVAYSTANINEEIGASGQISGDFSTDKLNYLVQTMQAGALPARLKDTPLSERAVGSSLGQSNLHQAFSAGVIGLVIVILVMLVYYTVAGVVANVALLLNVLFVLAAMAMLGARFTLAGIAGVILTIGMAVDANVLIFERMREERERGASLRIMIKNGYDKAFSTIIDANITTLLTSLILFYVGSEEIKGFGLTLGWGIVISLFTALFVTRTLFSWMAKAGMIKDLKMAKIIGVPNVNWYGLRGGFALFSAIVIIPGLFLLFNRGADALDVEFRGGVNAEIELRRDANLDDPAIQKLLGDAGDHIAAQGDAIGQATVSAVPNEEQVYRVQAPGGTSAELLAAIVAEPLEEAKERLVERGGVAVSGEGDAVIIQGTSAANVEKLQTAIRGLTSSVRQSGANIAASRVGAVLGGGPEDKGRFWDITTTETNKRLVQVALVDALADKLVIQPRIAHRFVGQPTAPQLPYPIDNRRLSAVVPTLPDRLNTDLTDFLGGAALVFDKLEPAVSVQDFEDRLRAMRLQPDYANIPWRRFEVIGVDPAGKDMDGHETYTRVVVVVVDSDPDYAYSTDAGRWATGFASQEVALAGATLDREQTLRKVTQFKPQIASQSQSRAIMALVLSWAMIIGYLWIRFGRPAYGVAGVIALIHDVFMALAFLGYAAFIGGSGGIGGLLLIDKFKIDMTVIAAFLTIVGYSLNDTIVVYDRIRENLQRQGKRKTYEEVLNASINETLSRTILTSGTTLLVVVALFFLGGAVIHDFAFVLMVGIAIGTYSSIFVASPCLILWEDYVGKRMKSKPKPKTAEKAA